MDDKTLKISSTLSDPTRYSIYQYISELHQGVTVQQIADQFGIHPNVARLHLNKLEDVNMLVSRPDKSGKGGRPSRIYQLSDEVVSIQFPHRDYQLLSEIALKTILSMGEDGERALRQTGYQLGKEVAQADIRKQNLNIATAPVEELIESIKNTALIEGINPEIIILDEQNIKFRIFNCSFKELAAHHPLVCKMHHAILTGIFEAYFREIKLTEEALMPEGCTSCDYTLVYRQ